MRQILALILFPSIFSLASIQAQEIKEIKPSNTAEEFEKQYERNIRKSRINGVYIPKDLNDAINELVKLSPPESLEKFKIVSEDIVAKKLHFGMGRWMIVNWNFYEGSRLSNYLKNLGVGHPDDMADFLIVSLHRHLNGKDLKTAESAAIIKKKNIEKVKKRRKVIDTIKIDRGGK